MFLGGGWNGYFFFLFPPIAEVMKTPPGLRSGSLAALQAKLNQENAHMAAQEQRILELEKAPLDPATIPAGLDGAKSGGKAKA